jgi:hypothetical protein
MNIFNRVLVGVISILGLVLSSALLLAAVIRDGLPLINLTRNLSTTLEQQPLANWLVAGVAFVFLLISLLLLLLEVLPGEERIPLREIEGASASVTMSAVRQFIEAEVERVPSIERAKAEVSARGPLLNVRLTARTGPDDPVPVKTVEVANTVRTVVEDRLGLRLGKVEVQVAPQLRRGRNAQPPARRVAT